MEIIVVSDRDGGLMSTRTIAIVALLIAIFLVIVLFFR
jgi:hypothetical protein